jgi:hypothetical protein
LGGAVVSCKIKLIIATPVGSFITGLRDSAADMQLNLHCTLAALQILQLNFRMTMMIGCQLLKQGFLFLIER